MCRFMAAFFTLVFLVIMYYAALVVGLFLPDPEPSKSPKSFAPFEPTVSVEPKREGWDVSKRLGEWAYLKDEQGNTLA